MFLLIKLCSLLNKIKTLLLTYIYSKRVRVIGNSCKINNICHFGNKAYIGNDCHFNGISIIGTGKTYFGDHFHSGSEVTIITSSHNYKSTTHLPYDNTEIIDDVIIGNYVWLGTRVTLLPGTKLEDGVIVQAGSVGHGIVPKCAIVGGNPAKIFRFRDKEIFKELSNKNSYI